MIMQRNQGRHKISVLFIFIASFVMLMFISANSELIKVNWIERNVEHWEVEPPQISENTDHYRMIFEGEKNPWYIIGDTLMALGGIEQRNHHTADSFRIVPIIIPDSSYHRIVDFLKSQAGFFNLVEESIWEKLDTEIWRGGYENSGSKVEYQLRENWSTAQICDSLIPYADSVVFIMGIPDSMGYMRSDSSRMIVLAEKGWVEELYKWVPALPAGKANSNQAIPRPRIEFPYENKKCKVVEYVDDVPNAVYPFPSSPLQKLNSEKKYRSNGSINRKCEMCVGY